MNNVRAFSPLLNSWFADVRVREAVDALTPGKLPTEFNPDLAWEEFPDYVDAWLASQQVVAEWCKNLFEMWDEVWACQLGSMVKYWPREKIRDELSNGGIREAWESAWHARGVRTPRGDVNLVIYCDADNAWLQIELSEEMADLSLRGWETDNADETALLNGPKVPIRVGDGVASLDLDQLRQHAEQAIALLWAVPITDARSTAGRGAVRSQRKRK